MVGEVNKTTLFESSDDLLGCLPFLSSGLRLPELGEVDDGNAERVAARRRGCRERPQPRSLAGDNERFDSEGEH